MDQDRHEQTLDAGPFGEWLDGFLHARAAGTDMDVPCGDCTACCRARQFVHVEADETETLAHIPAELLFPAPGHRDGTRVMGYDTSGCCPMLQDGRCSIYRHRPRACRAYDCRVFAAAATAPGDPAQTQIAARVLRWRFDVTGKEDHQRHTAVTAAAGFLRRHAAEFPELHPERGINLALRAIDLHERFLNPRSP